MTCNRCKAETIQIITEPNNKIVKLLIIIIGSILIALIGHGIKEQLGETLRIALPLPVLIICFVVLLQKNNKTKAVCLNCGHKWYI